MLQAGLRCSARIPTYKNYSFPGSRIRHSEQRAPSGTLGRSSDSSKPGRPASSSSSSSGKGKEGATSGHWKPPPLPNLILPKRTVCIKGWTSFANMVEVFAVLRTVELKYGSFIEYHVTKDFEMPEKPFAMIFAAFAEPASYKLVPPGGIEMAIPAPVYKPQPGGVGWEDIENLLGEADRDPDFERNHVLAISDRPGHVRQHMYVRVSPSKKEINSFAPPPDRLPSPEMQRQIAEKFLQWGGSQALTPISSKRPITDRELFGESSLSNVRMRTALRWAAKALNKRSPYEIYPVETEKMLPESESLLPAPDHSCLGKKAFISLPTQDRPMIFTNFSRRL